MLPLLKLIGLAFLVAVVLALSAERYLSGQSSGWDVLSHILIACWLLYEVWQRFRENAKGKLEEPLRCPKVPRGKCRFDFPQKQNKWAEDA